MNNERDSFDQYTKTTGALPVDTKEVSIDDEKLHTNTLVITSESFDLDNFFGPGTAKNESEIENQESTSEIPTVLPDLVVTLRNDANESITTLSTKITAESFAAGASLTSSVFSALSSIVGSCGIVCAHSIGSLAQAGSSISGLGGISMPGLRTDAKGNLHMDSNIDTLSKITGISKKNLLAGRFSAQDLVTAFFTVFSETIHYVFGLGLVGMLIGCMFDCLAPLDTEVPKPSLTA